MPHPLDPAGPANTLLDNGEVVPYTPVNSTLIPTIKGYQDVTFEYPHDNKALYLPMIQGKLSRGFIAQDKNDPAVKNNRSGRPLGLHFLYNPTSVQVSYSINTDIYPPDASAGSDVPIIGVPGSASVSFDLILDRTYDVWNNRRSMGIKYDVDQFLAMLQYTDDSPYIQPVAVFAVFGNPLLKFYGFIQSFSIVYTNWTQYMVPYRGGISGITLQVMPGVNSPLKLSDITKNSPGFVAAVQGSSSSSTTSSSTDTGNGRSGAAAA